MSVNRTLTPFLLRTELDRLRREMGQLPGVMHELDRLRREMEQLPGVMHELDRLRREMERLPGVMHELDRLRREMERLPGVMHESNQENKVPALPIFKRHLAAVPPPAIQTGLIIKAKSLK